MDPKKLLTLPVPHSEVHHNDFHAALSGAMKTSQKVKDFVHLYQPNEYAGMKTFLSPDKASGYAVKPDGDIVSVFSTEKGRGDDIVQHAIKNGGSKLDAFDGYLPKFYEKHGFKEVHREKNWTPNGPDVVYMGLHHANKEKLAASEDIFASMAKSEFYMKSKELSKAENLGQPSLKSYFMAYDGDNAGRLVGRAILADDAQSLHDASNRIAHGHDIVKEWVTNHQGKVISGGGDEGTFLIPEHSIDDIEKLRADYKYATNLTMTVGVGHSLSEAGKALMAGKFRGKNQVCMYDQTIESELSQSQAHVADGSATDEERKLGEAYLTPEGAQMKETEDSHADCQYCAELAQDNVQDEDHCQYCHDVPSEDMNAQPHCQYCAEADQAQPEHDPNAEGHAADCQYCQEAAQPDHEHSGDDCQYCAEAEAKPSHDHTGDDCEYCAQAPTDAPAAFYDQDVNSESMQAIAQQIEQTTHAGQTPSDVLSSMDGQDNGPADMPGTEMQDNVSHPANFQSGQPQDMGMAEDAPQGQPDLTQVLSGGLDNHADNIQKERVMQMVSEALEGFKGCRDILERAQQQAPQLYDSSLAMLKAMIEMAKMLGLAPAQEQSQPGSSPGQPDPAQDQSNPQAPQGNPQPAQSGGDPAGKPMGR